MSVKPLSGVLREGSNTIPFWGLSTKVVSVKRLELLTNGLKGRCSTIELHARSGLHSIMPIWTRQLLSAILNLKQAPVLARKLLREIQ